MKNKRRKWILHVIAFVLIVAMLIPMTAPVSVQAADLYLAYQTDENRTAVTKLKTSQREKYRVSKMYLEEGQKVDLCFINAVLWENAQWKSSNPEVATVNNAGVITAVSAGVTEITLTYSRKYTGTEISASAMAYVGEENWDIRFLPIYAEEKEGYYEVEAGESIDFIFAGISEMDNPDLYSMSLTSSDEDVATVSRVSGLTVTTTKPGFVTVTLDIKNKVTGNIIHKKVMVKSLPVTIQEMPLTIQEKMDYLLKQLGVEPGKEVFFTVNQKACTEHVLTGDNKKNSCENCRTTNIVKQTWFKNIFGEVKVKYFPWHVKNPAGEKSYTGGSCFGFTCFAQWYLYADAIDETVTANVIGPVKFTKKNMENYVQPGDVLRISNLGHSLLVYSVEEDHLKVIDSNWTSGGTLPHCLVQLRMLKYDALFMKEDQVYIHRVTDSDVAGVYLGKTPGNTPDGPETSGPTNPETSGLTDPGEVKLGMLDLSATSWSTYNVGTNVEMGADKAYPIRHGSIFKI